MTNQKWQYCATRYEERPGALGKEGLDRHLNQMGERGWELVNGAVSGAPYTRDPVGHPTAAPLIHVLYWRTPRQ